MSEPSQPSSFASAGYIDNDEPNWATPYYEGPWIRTQIGLALLIGLPSFLLFCSLRRNSTVLFAPRTKLKGFSPHEAHDTSSFFGWILPTLRTSEYTVLQIVGLDAAVLLNFLKMSFWFFSVAAAITCPILVPINYKKYGTWEASDDSDEGDNSSTLQSNYVTIAETLSRISSNDPWDALRDNQGKWRKVVDVFVLSNIDPYLGLQLIFTFFLSILALKFVHKNYLRFTRQRQLFSLELVHAISARTVMIESLPLHLRDEKALTEYFDSISLQVESVSLVKDVESLDELLSRRTKALLELEAEWCKYLGNPSRATYLTPTSDLETPSSLLTVQGKSRPTTRSGFMGFSGIKIDKLRMLERRFENLDTIVKTSRKSEYKNTHVSFVTFENASSAQVASQCANYPEPGQVVTNLAPEPRDVVWENVALSTRAIISKRLFVYSTVITLLLTWAIPVTVLYTLLQYSEISKHLPALARLLEKYPSLRALVQTSLPPLALVLFNATLPLFLHFLCSIQGHKARSHIEYSLMKKYFLALFMTVVFARITTATISMVRELADAPLKIPDKLAQSLKSSTSRHFFVSYVILQGIGILPMHLLQLNQVLPHIFLRPFTKTPRDYAELNAPPELNYGIMSPYILIAAAVYFGMAYLVYKYKLLFIFYKPWESSGQAWPITYARCCWGVVLFQVFMLGLFTLQGAFLYSSVLLPVIAGTVSWAFSTENKFRGLSQHVNSLHEAQRGTLPTEIVGLRYDQSVPRSQSNLNRRRYAMNDAALYVAPESDKTDYSQPPMRYWYYGVLNTGRRRYGHPALTGILPEMWLPQQQTVSTQRNSARNSTYGGVNDGRVLTLRKRWSTVKRDARDVLNRRGSGSFTSRGGRNNAARNVAKRSSQNSFADPYNPANPWVRVDEADVDAGDRARTVSYDGASGVIALPEGELFSDEDDEDDEDDEVVDENHDEDANDDNDNDEDAPESTEKEVKQLEDYTKEVDSLVEDINENSDITQSVDRISVLEKKARNANDLKSTSRLVVKAVDLAVNQKNLDKLKEIVHGFSKKHGQMRTVIIEAVRAASGICDEDVAHVYTLQGQQREDLIQSLRAITEGKMFLESERARLTYILAHVLLSRNETRKARDVLSELSVETFGSLDRRQKTDYLLQQALLNAQIGDWVQMKIVTNKINVKFFKEENTQEQKLRYYEYLIRYAVHNDEYLNACRYYREVYDTDVIKSDPSRSKVVLENIVYFVLLAPFNHEQHDLLHRIFTDQTFNTPKLQYQYNLLKCFTTPELMRWAGLEALYGQILKSTDVFSNRSTDGKGQTRFNEFHKRVLEHNVRVIYKYYTNITLKRLQSFLEVDERQVEEILSSLVENGTIYAKIDRPAKMITFTKPKRTDDVLNDFTNNISKLLSLVETVNYQIEKEKAVQEAFK
ncbi:hypothetical protein E3P78_02670 [Wallemia ichthyophaga]|nr:hypothetical protein E3P78_02670 [Wallemia ichthyophaga]